MEYIKMEDVSTKFCLKKINLSLVEGEFVVILGHSGAGKSTLLNVIAGLVEHSGNLYLKRNLMNCISPQKRNIGYLQQGIHLFPHLTVFENIAFGLRAKRENKKYLINTTQEMMEMLHITHLSQRFPNELSGGEKQRVGIARSIVIMPKILLLDEPLSNLDRNIACNIRANLKKISEKLNLTVVYVTHDMEDAKELADKILEMNDGKIQEDNL